jgi:DNA-binding MarR family transcriptional regulator
MQLELDRFLPYRLSVLSNTLSQAIAAAYSDRFGLTIPEWRVIAVLAISPDLSAAEVAERTAMDKVAVSRAVNALLKSARVTRKFAAQDRRRSILRLSAIGRELYAKVVPLALGYEAALVESLSATERKALDHAIRVLLGRAKELGPVRQFKSSGREGGLR